MRATCLLHLCLLLPFQVLFEFSLHTLHPLLGKGQSTMNPGDEASARPIRPVCFNLSIQVGSQFSWTPISSLSGTTELCYQTCVGRQMSTWQEADHQWNQQELG